MQLHIFLGPNNHNHHGRRPQTTRHKYPINIPLASTKSSIACFPTDAKKSLIWKNPVSVVAHWSSAVLSTRKMTFPTLPPLWRKRRASGAWSNGKIRPTKGGVKEAVATGEEGGEGEARQVMSSSSWLLSFAARSVRKIKLKPKTPFDSDTRLPGSTLGRVRKRGTICQ